jgi:hypothetical protein
MWPVEKFFLQCPKYSVPIPQKTLCVCITKTNRLMLFGGIIYVCSDNRTKPINILCGQTTEF